ncbi:acetyl-CoA carboxylase carboxyl transferase subunit alpha [Alkalicoccobacillus plakortidis]|uniref:Acetyl-coenzyme A carboxylase carboxyl transferase subunit alpha n=1 Tax=Alkalicoccobacillus plakortidis TaxID=444060 RepID=A0ABT0XH88_9BACI|nr:acetyl-CoA carboxylase carboxyl transferase subunit alpha [Alkalicoccobacillus plakortidis]MCM2675266.1 acetyl-CoA carboxylase carboxyl transferase subunit alpha [Alkalicoccobacillus plakortidis]
MGNEMVFEKPISELKEKIEELQTFAYEKDIDLSAEIQRMEDRLHELEKEIYGNLKPWERVQIARNNKRPTTLDYIGYLFEDFIELHGDRLFSDDEAIVGGIAKFNGQPITVIGHQRGKDTKENIRRNFGSPRPEGYRKALRLMKQADKFKRPIICFIDTKGADPGKESEERGQSEAIARNLLEMAGLSVPVISIVIGEGGSGGALALGVADQIHMLENSTYSVISPEGAAALLWKDATQAQRAAETMMITAPDLKKLEIIDEIIFEPKGGAHLDVETQAHTIGKVIAESLAVLNNLSEEELLLSRNEKYKQMGRNSIEVL